MLYNEIVKVSVHATDADADADTRAMTLKFLKSRSNLQVKVTGNNDRTM